MDKNRGQIFYGTAGVAAIPLAACLLMSGCTSLPKGELALDLGVKDRGVASWYGKQFHGKLAANGEVFDMTAYTAAHRKLPLGSIVRVLNLDNGKSVHVRITDRGPYVLGRMLDLSQAAAGALDMVEKGTAPVQVEVIGAHRGLWPLPPQHWAHLSLSPEGLFTSRRSPKDMESPMVALRRMPQDALYVRRERRNGSVLPADYTAHKAVPTRLVC
ncbi:MAG TPA: septal ring lytic transglycosylase RlpA family protein [Nitrospira sp.]|nr:septal ring lytic transglycosylase RlpA family protein [Nitrospira sp.]